MKRIRGSSARDVLFGTDEDEWIEGLAGNDDLYGGGGNDVIHGGSGRDVLDGGVGDDELWFGWNDRAVDGGAGIDLARADFRSTGQDLRFSISDNLVGSVQVGSTAVRGIERLHILSGSGDDVWHGGAHADFISGGAGHDALFGEGGDDMLLGNGGNDELLGGAGDDYLEGGAGNDRLHAGTGHDTLAGGAGDDELNAGPDRNSLDGGSGNDLAVIDRSAAGLAIQFSLDNPARQQTLDNGTTVVNVERANLRTGAGADQLIGGRFADVFRAGDGNDRVAGADGDDELHGEGGNDLMYGGDGRDSLFGGAGDDFLNAARGDRLVDGGSGSDWGQLDFEDSVQSLFFAVAGNLAGTVVLEGTQIRSIEQIHFLGGRGNDTVIGGSLDDVIYGRRGHDVLRGEDGHDLLDGDEGDDRLFGATGEDLLRGGSGIDELAGGAGNDTLDGGAGIDRAIYTGRLQDYVADRMADGRIRIADIRAGAPDGADLVSNVELFSFADALLTPAQLLQALSNRAPVAAADAVTAGEDEPTLLEVLGNDRDPNAGDAITITDVMTTGLRGQVTLAPDGKLYYAANGAFEELGAGQTATESFSYTIRDRAGLTSTAAVTVTIEGSNDAPVAIADLATASAAGSTIIDPLANDFDPDTGDVLALASLSFAGTIGTAWFGANNTVIYTPGTAFRSLGAGQTATDTFFYSVNDGHPGTGNLVSTNAVTVVVVGVNDGPTAADDGFTVAHTGAVALGNLLANDFDIDQGDTISAVPVEGTSTRGAHFSIDADGLAHYDPGQIFATLPPGATTTDSFTYTVVDSHGATSTATVNLTVNAAGIALDPRLRVVADPILEGGTTGNIFDLLADRAAAFGATIVAIGTPTQGAVTYDLAAHYLNFSAATPDLDYLWHGDTLAFPTFTYTIRDASGATRMGEAKMYVQGVDDPAVATDDAMSLQAGAAVRLYDRLIENDDPDSRLIDITGFDTAGTLGRIFYDPSTGHMSYAADTPELMALAPGETIVDHFTYGIRDRVYTNGPVTTATVTVTVTGVEHASPMTGALMAYGLAEAPADALQAYAAPETHVTDPLMTYGAPEGQHAFMETGFLDSPLHDPADFFARSLNHWASHMELAM